MDSYGQVFRYLRKNKGLTLKELAEDGLSVSLIAQFEKDQSKIAFDRLIILLTKLSVNLNEFMQLVNQGQLAKEDSLIKDFYQLINSYTYLHDQTAKRPDFELLQTEITTYVKANPSLKLEHFLIFIKLYLSLLAEFEKGHGPVSLVHLSEKVTALAYPVQHYLLQVEIWGVYELELLNRVSLSFEPSILWRLVQQANKRAATYQQLPGLNNLIFHTLYSNLTTFVALEAFEYAFKTLELIETQLKATESLRFATILPFYQGWVYYFMGQKEKANALFNKTITSYDCLGLTQSATEFRQLEKTIKESKQAGVPLVMIYS